VRLLHFAAALVGDLTKASGRSRLTLGVRIDTENAAIAGSFGVYPLTLQLTLPNLHCGEGVKALSGSSNGGILRAAGGQPSNLFGCRRWDDGYSAPRRIDRCRVWKLSIVSGRTS
jgi:hypothetical protein